jgi:hypothetical protein
MMIARYKEGRDSDDRYINGTGYIRDPCKDRFSEYFRVTRVDRIETAREREEISEDRISDLFRISGGANNSD